MKTYIFEHKKSRLTLYVLLILVIARLFAPVVIEKFINQKLDNKEGISGYIENIDLALFRGAYKIKGLTLYLQEKVTDTPSVYIETLDLSILWSAFFRGKIVANADMSNGEFKFIDELSTDNKLKKEVVNPDNWLTLINYAAPISVDKVTFNNIKTTLVFHAENTMHSSYLGNIEGEITNITNSHDFSGNQIAKFNIKGMLMSKAKVELSGSLNPETTLPTFDINFEMQRLPVFELDELIDFYTPLDVEKGEIDTALELASNNGDVNGYVKIGIYNANTFIWKEDIIKDDDGIFTGFFEGMVDIFTSLLEADKQDLLAINVPITGTISAIEISTWDALISLFHNGFIDVYEIEIDDSITSDTAEK